MMGGRACNQGNFPDIDPSDKVVRMASRVRTTAVETVNSQPLSQSLLPDLSFGCIDKSKPRLSSLVLVEVIRFIMDWNSAYTITEGIADTLYETQL